MTVLAIDPDIRSNSDLIAACFDLGYLDDSWLILDATYGEAGGFWKTRRPPKLIARDRKTHPDWDFRKMQFGGATFDAVVFDPPYKLNGTPDEKVDARYGVDVPGTIDERLDLMYRGLRECIRVTKPGGFVLVKCQDQVASGRVWWQTDLMTFHAERRDCRKVDLLHFMSYRPQPEGRRQVHARRNYSSLIVFKKEK